MAKDRSQRKKRQYRSFEAPNGWEIDNDGFLDWDLPRIQEGAEVYLASVRDGNCLYRYENANWMNHDLVSALCRFNQPSDLQEILSLLGDKTWDGLYGLGEKERSSIEHVLSFYSVENPTGRHTYQAAQLRLLVNTTISLQQVMTSLDWVDLATSYRAIVAMRKTKGDQLSYLHLWSSLFAFAETLDSPRNIPISQSTLQYLDLHLDAQYLPLINSRVLFATKFVTLMLQTALDALIRDVLYNEWSMDQGQGYKALRKFAYQQPKLAPGQCLLVHQNQSLFLVQSGTDHFLFNSASSEVRRIDAPRGLVAILFSLDRPEDLETTLMRKPVSSYLKRKFKIGGCECFLPSGWKEAPPVIWSEDNDPEAEDDDDILTYIYGLPLEPILIDGSKKLYRHGDSYLLTDPNYCHLNRVDSPKDLADIINTLDTPASLKVSSLTSAVPDNLVPSGWTNRHKDIQPCKRITVPKVLLVHKSYPLYFLEFQNGGHPGIFAFWYYEDNTINYITMPYGLYELLPLFKNLRLLKTTQREVPSSVIEQYRPEDPIIVNTAKGGLSEVLTDSEEVNELE